MSGVAFGIFLYSGILIPPRYADGFTYSLRSHAICVKMVSEMPESSGKKMVKCIAKIDEKAVPIS
jgi:hypothetical protein